MDRAKIREVLLQKSVLFVEDDEEILQALGSILKKRFKDLIEAKSGIEGLEAFNTKQTDLVITDVTMPKMNGIKMSEEILKIAPDTKIIFTTGHSEEEYLQKIEKLKSEYIPKPIELTVLLEKCAEALS